MTEPTFDPSVDQWIDRMLAPVLADVERYLDAVGAPPDLRARMMAEAHARGRQELRAELVRLVEHSVRLDALERQAADVVRHHDDLLRRYDAALRRWLERARPAGHLRWPA